METKKLIAVKTPVDYPSVLDNTKPAIARSVRLEKIDGRWRVVNVYYMTSALSLSPFMKVRLPPH